MSEHKNWAKTQVQSQDMVEDILKQVTWTSTNPSELSHVSSDYPIGAYTLDDGFLYIKDCTQAELDALVAQVTANAPAKALAKKQQEIDLAFEQAFENVIAGYPHEEVETWIYQLDEAKDILAGKTDPTPVIDAIATETGVTRDVLAQSVMDKALLYKQTIGTLVGKRHRLQAQLAAIDLTSPTAEADIAAIVW